MRLTLLTVAAPVSGGMRFDADGEPEPRDLDRCHAARGQLAGATRVLCSPAPIAAATALALGLEAVSQDELRDRAYGAWSGQTLKDVAAAEPALFACWLKDVDAAPPGGETVRDLTARAQGWLGGFNSEEGHVLAITHPPVVRACLAAATGLPRLWFCFDVGYATRTVLTRHRQRWRVALVNAPV